MFIKMTNGVFTLFAIFLLKWQNMCYDITIIKKRLEFKGEYEWQKN